jgi:hypothetical protein
MPLSRACAAAALAAVCVAGLVVPGAPVLAATTPWPEVPHPPRSQFVWALQDALVNGVPTQAEQFESELSVDEVLGFYGAHWAGMPAGKPIRKHVADWETISTVLGPFQLAVQVAASSPRGSHGLVSVTNPGESRKDWQPAGWPSWSDTRILQVTDTKDGGKRSEHVSAFTRASFETTIERWRESWTQRGYRLAHEQKMPAMQGQRGWIGLFDGPAGSLDVTVTATDDGHQVSIQANRLTPPKGLFP